MHLAIAQPRTHSHRLLDRPQIAEGEWWDGFVFRVLEANGLGTESDYWSRLLGAAVEAGVREGVKDQHFAGRVSTSGATFFGLRSMPVWSLRGRGGQVRVCRACLKEGCYVRMEWRLRGYDICIKHGEALARECQQCGKSHFLIDVARQRCSCGTPVSVGQPLLDLKIADELVRAARRVWGAELSHFSAVAHDQTPTLLLQQRLASQITLARLLVELSRITWSPGDMHISGLPSEARRTCLLETFGDQLEPSVKGFGQVLLQLSSIHHKRSAARLLYGIANAERRYPTILSSLPIDAWLQQLASRGASSGQVRSTPGRPVDSAQRQIHSISSAARLAHTSMPRVHEMMQQGLVRPATTAYEGSTHYHFTPDQVAEIARLKSLEAPWHKEIGLAPDALARFLRSGIVRRVRTVSSYAVAGVSGWRTLVRGLEAFASPLPADTAGLVSLGSSRLWMRSQAKDMRGLFEDLQTGRRPLFFSPGGGTGLGRFYTPATTVLAVYQQRRLTQPRDEGERNQGELFDACASV